LAGVTHVRRRFWGVSTMLVGYLRRAVGPILFCLMVNGAGGWAVLAQSSSDLDALNQQIVRLFDAGRYAEATAAAEHAVKLAERQFGSDHPLVGTSLSNLASLYNRQGRYSEAEPLYKRALSIAEKTLGANNPTVGIRLNNIAELYKAQGRYVEAEPLLKQSLVIVEKAYGPDHPAVATSLNNLAQLYSAEGRYSEAEPLSNRALAITGKALGPDHPTVAIRLANLAELYRDEGRYRDAEPLMTRALAISEKALGPDHPDVGLQLRNLALLYQAEGRYGDAEPPMKRSLAINEKALGAEHPDVGRSLNDLAVLYEDEADFNEAEPLLKRALAIAEKSFGPNHPTVGVRLTNLAWLYRDQGRYDEAEALMKRVLAMTEKVLGPANFAAALNDLAGLYRHQGRYDEAEPLMKQSLAITEQVFGPDHPGVGNYLDNLAGLYRDEGRYDEAEPIMKRALAINEKTLGLDHPTVATALNNLALLYEAQGRSAEAEPLIKRALSIDEKALGTDHPDLATDYDNLASLYFSQRDWVRAANYWRASTKISIRRTQRGSLVIGHALTGRTRSEAELKNDQFWHLVKAVNRLASQQRTDADLSREMFQTAQWAQNSEAAQSLAQMAAREAKGDRKLAALVRERQDLVAEWEKRDEIRSAAVARPPEQRDAQTEASNNTQLGVIDSRIAEIDKDFAADFPDYAALASPAPLSVEAVQAELDANEALVLFLDTPEDGPTPGETFIWVVTKTDLRWVRSDLGTSALADEVATLRCGLDFDGSWFDGKSGWNGSRCNGLLKVEYSRADREVGGKPLPFDLGRAHALYKALFGQIEDLIKNKQLLIAPSGSLAQLPFQVLVTEPPKSALPPAFVDYRRVAWLARKHAIAVLPAVSSLKVLREFAKQSRAGEPYIGFGNPLLDGDPAHFKGDAVAAQLAREARCPGAGVQTASLLERGKRGRVRSSGGIANVADIRSWAPLPETVDELCDVAQHLGVDPSTHLYLGARATETQIKALSDSGVLARYRIVHFATHGALSGDVSRTSEPGLLLTPPREASEIDDGYLTTSEIADLKLDADWVILSACNTAAGNAKNAQALSGLARAFFYAGSRSLLVSHWEVASESTVNLIAKAVAELKADPKIGRAEALRRSELELIDKGKTYEAHPAFWAPFVLVGEGGAAR
jgi:CHAT domain-containing protein/tetratricopeptide (TPR) repeat protein